MDLQAGKRLLIKNGIFVIFLGLLTGLVINNVKIPRMALAAHVEAIMVGMLLIIIGKAVWDELSLPKKLASIALWFLIYAAYGTWGYVLLSAVLGTSRAMPIAGAGYSALEWQENMVHVLLASNAIAILIAFCILLYGLRGRKAKGIDSTNTRA